MSAASLVQRARTARAPAGGSHQPAGTAKRAKGAAKTTGELTVRIVTASIFLPDPTQAPLAGDRVFDVTIRPIGGGRSRAKVYVKQGATLGPFACRPGQYRIDVAEHVSKGVFQKYPDGACEAVVHVGKATTAFAVLAIDTLRAVAERCAFRVGTLVGFYDLNDSPPPTSVATIANEFNLATVCIPWESIQPKAPPATSPLSLPLFAQPDEAQLEAALAVNGWDTSKLKPLITALLALPGMEILPTPLSWFTTGQVPRWFKAGVKPSAHQIAEDHLQALMRYVERLTAAPPPAHPRVHTYVAVNELEDTGDTELWGGLPSRRPHDLPERLTRMAEHYLGLAHAEGAGAELLINDFDHEFYPPARRGAKGKLARAIAGIRPQGARAARFHQTMAAVQKVGTLRGHVGAGYQMHFRSLPKYLAAPALYRSAMRDGIQRLARLRARVAITEMAVTVLPLFNKTLASSYIAPPPYYGPDGVTVSPAWTAWDNERITLFGANGYAATAGDASWRKQAQVFRDIVTTYLLEPECNTLVFWGFADGPGDDVNDLYGHLFDSAPGGTQGAYPEGPGCARKPAYYAVLNALIEGGHGRRGAKKVPNWRRRWHPKP